MVYAWPTLIRAPASPAPQFTTAQEASATLNSPGSSVPSNSPLLCVAVVSGNVTSSTLSATSTNLLSGRAVQPSSVPRTKSSTSNGGSTLLLPVALVLAAATSTAASKSSCVPNLTASAGVPK